MPYNNSMALIDWRKYFDKEMLEDGKLLEKKGRIWLEIRFPISVHLSSFCLSCISRVYLGKHYWFFFSLRGSLLTSYWGISDKSGHKEEYKEDFGIAGKCWWLFSHRYSKNRFQSLITILMITIASFFWCTLWEFLFFFTRKR